MKRVFRAGAAAACVLGAGSVAAIAQSSDSASSKRPGISSWFSGMFGGAKGNEGSPVDLDFRISGDRNSLLGELRTTSLLVSAQDEGRVTGQDMLAAARGDYARLLGVLYDHGYYSVIINITLDGVEAASIAPLDAPKVVHKVLVNIDPGAALSLQPRRDRAAGAAHRTAAGLPPRRHCPHRRHEARRHHRR